MMMQPSRKNDDANDGGSTGKPGKNGTELARQGFPEAGAIAVVGKMSYCGCRNVLKRII